MVALLKSRVFDLNIMSQLDLGTIAFIVLFMIDRAAFLRNPHFLSMLPACGASGTFSYQYISSSSSLGSCDFVLTVMSQMCFS